MKRFTALFLAAWRRTGRPSSWLSDTTGPERKQRHVPRMRSVWKRFGRCCAKHMQSPPMLPRSFPFRASSSSCPVRTERSAHLPSEQTDALS